MTKKSKGIVGFLSDLWYGTDKSQKESKQPDAQDLQEAVALKMQSANAKGDAASAQMVAAQSARQDLGKLVVQHDELGRQALLSEKEGNVEMAKKIVALKLAVKAKIKTATERYEQTNKIATQLVRDARKMFKEAKEVSDDLPRKVMQIEVNRMLENAALLEGESRDQLASRSNYEALTASIDVQTQRLLVRGMLKESNDTMDEEIKQVLGEKEFEEEYKLIQRKAKLGDDVIDAEFTETDVSKKAKLLLAEPAFGGLLYGGDSFEIKQESSKIKIVKATIVETKNDNKPRE